MNPDSGRPPANPPRAKRAPAPSAWTVYVPDAERVVVGSMPDTDLEGWRHHEPTPWTLGILVAASAVAFFSMATVGIFTLIGQIRPWAGLVAAFVLASALGWTLWDFRFRPVWRWIVWGSLTGLIGGMASVVALFVVD